MADNLATHRLTDTTPIIDQSNHNWATKMDRAQQFSQDPTRHGFVQIGWAIRLDSGYLREWRILKPSAGVSITADEHDALVFDQPKLAYRVAARMNGTIAEVWESQTERLICWGDHIPASRRD